MPSVPELRAVRPRPATGAAEVREMVPADDDAALVVRALEGDRWAEEALYRRHVRRVTEATTRVLGRTMEAEDVVQETFLKALTGLEKLREPAYFERWLMRIAMNRVRSRLRRRKVLRSLGLDRTTDDATLERLAAPTTPPHVRAELVRVDAVLRELPSGWRMAWMLNAVEGLTLPETADACGCSLATVKRWIKGARDRLAEHVRDASLLEPPAPEEAP